MSGEKQIQHLTRAGIDDSKWDDCIQKAVNGVIYGCSFYLDAMATHWDALVLNDYEAAMPLPWRRKWGISYLYQPFLTAQLGVFGKNISADLLFAFLDAIPKKFRYWDFPFNHRNLFQVSKFPLYERMNYVLPMNKRYDELWKGYNENIRRNIKKSRDNGCTVRKEISIDSVIELAKLQTKKFQERDFESFKNLFLQLQKKSVGKTYGIASKNGELLASAAFLFSHNRAYYILVGNHPTGRKLGASHALIDAFVHDHAGQDLLLDFEGSDIHSLAFFYSSFGAIEEKYAAIKWSSLPRWLKSGSLNSASEK